jgi:hypothetical protein
MGRTRKNKKGGVNNNDLNDSFDQGQPLTLDDLNPMSNNNIPPVAVNNIPAVAVNNIPPVNNQYDAMIANDDGAMNDGPMTIDELQVPPPNPEDGVTDTEMMDTDDENDDYLGGRKTRKNRKSTKKQRKTNKKNRKTTKRRKPSKGKKTNKGRKTRKQRGGGYGTNCAQPDPNFSIYNTRELTLFPYRPTNQ